MAHEHHEGHQHGHQHGHDHGHGHGHGHEHKHEQKHDHKHDHDHGPHHHGAGGHHHHGDPTTQGRAFVIAIVLNLGFVAIEFIYGLIANSTALLADAGHNLSDVLGLVLALGATILARRAPSSRFTYGLRSSSILAAFANAMFLLIACGGVAWEAIQRFSSPPPIAGLTVTLVAAAGIVVNGVSAWLFVRGSKNDLNVRAAYMHMMADAAVSLGVVITGLVMMGTGWYWLDPVASIVIVIVIVIGTWGLLRESTQLALSAVPSHIDCAAVEAHLLALPGVTAVHDLHIWGMSTTEAAMTVHLVMPGGYPGDVFIDEAMASMKSRFAIEHCTIQFELGTTNHVCGLHAPKAAQPHAGHAHAH